MSHLIKATYYIETPFALEHTARVMAGEQSTGTFVSIPGESEFLQKRHGAHIESIKELEPTNEPSLPGSVKGQSTQYNRGYVTVTFPFHNVGASVPNLLATVAGNLFELKELSGIRLVDIDLPVEFQQNYGGPKFGIQGTRDRMDVHNRPFIGTIIKPSIGLAGDELRKVIRELVDSGIDFIKDDELTGNPPYFPLKERVAIVMDEIKRCAQETGKEVMYACNITDDIHRLQENYEKVINAGGNCVMVSINSIGFAGVAYLRQFSEVPIHGHRNQWGYMTRYPKLGMSFSPYQKLSRLVGVDHLHCNGLNNKFYESNESVVESVKQCLTPVYNDDTILPVLSSGQWAGTAIETYKAIQSVDVMHLAGGGIIGHPDGIHAGVLSMQQGWEAAKNGVSLNDYATDHVELKRAVEFFRKS